MRPPVESDQSPARGVGAAEEAHGIMADDEPRNLEALLDELNQSGSDAAVSVGDVLDRFQHRSLGVLIALVGLIAVIPLVGDIPGVPSIAATLVLVAIARSVLGREGLWLPGFIGRRSISRDRLERSIEKARPWLRRIDRLLRPRLHALTDNRMGRNLAVLASAALALSLYPMEVVPFGANLAGAGLIGLGLGLMTRDGVLLLIGYAFAIGTVYLLVTAGSSTLS